MNGMAIRHQVVASVTAGLLLLLLWWASAFAQPAEAAVPVRICDQNQGWHRPDPQTMARTVWRDSRYVDFASGTINSRELAFYTHHFLFFTTVTASGASHALDWTGLALARASPCGTGPDAALERGQAVVIWILGYAFKNAAILGNTLTLTVQPNATAEQGYTIVEVPRPGASWIARFVLTTGRELARVSSPELICCADEVPPDVAVPSTVPRPADGLAVLDGPGSLTVQAVAGQPRATDARYLALVAVGTPPLRVAERYAAAFRSAGFSVGAVSSTGDTAAFTFTASPSTDHGLASGQVLVSPPPGRDVPGAVTVSLTLTYADDQGRTTPPAHVLPTGGGLPTVAILVTAVFGAALLGAGLLVRRALTCFNLRPSAQDQLDRLALKQVRGD